MKNAVSFLPRLAWLAARGLCQDGKGRRPTEQRRPTHGLTFGVAGRRGGGGWKEPGERNWKEEAEDGRDEKEK